MRQKSIPAKEPAEQVVKDIRRATRRHFSSEDKIRIVLEGPSYNCVVGFRLTYWSGGKALGQAPPGVRGLRRVI